MKIILAWTKILTLKNDLNENKRYIYIYIHTHTHTHVLNSIILIKIVKKLRVCKLL